MSKETKIRGRSLIYLAILLLLGVTVCWGWSTTDSTDKVQQIQEPEDEKLILLFPEDKEEGTRSGVYIVNPSIIGLRYQKALVPLRHISYNIQIINSLVHITLEQQYQNPLNTSLNILYSFPIQPDTSIYKLTANFDNIIIEGIVKEKEQARKQFQQAKRQGRQAVLGELDVNSKDIVNLQIGNIPARTRVKIMVSFVQELSVGMNQFYQLLVPSTISPRYMNTVPNPSNSDSYPRQSTIDSLQTAVLKQIYRPDYTWNFVLTLRAMNRIVFDDCASHELVKVSSSEDQTQIVYTLQKNARPNKDFNFIYSPEKFQHPTYVIGQNEDSTTVMLSFIPKFSKLKIEEAYKNLRENKPQEFDISEMKGEYIFILDRSGSMDFERMQQAKKSLIIFLKSLPSDSFYNVISFGSHHEKMYPESVTYQDTNIKNSINKIQEMTSDLGGTQIYYPLQQALDQKIIEGYPKFIFLLTDGEVFNTEDVILMAKKKARFARISSIGIGNGASLRLIQGCAQAGRGKYVMISDEQNPAEKIVFLLESSLTPLIEKIRLNFDRTDVESITPNPATIPYIIKDSIVNFYVTFKGKITEPKKFQLQYEDSISKKVHKSEIIVVQGSQNYPYVDKMAHFRVLRNLEDLSRQKQPTPTHYLQYTQPITDYKKQSITYSIKNQILSQYTSFIAIGKQLLDRQKNIFKELGSYTIEVQQTPPIQYQDLLNFKAGFGFGGGSMLKVGLRASMSMPKMQHFSFYSSGISLDLYDGDGGLADDFDDQVQSVPHIHGNQYDEQYEQNQPEEQQQQPTPSTQSSQQQLTIPTLISLQTTQGYWNTPDLLQKLAQNPTQATDLAKQFGQDIIITKLALLWLEKYKAGKQYALIIKKAESWLRKEIGLRGLMGEGLAGLGVI